MRGVCAITLDADKAFISSAIVKGRFLNFLGESEVSIPYEGGEVASYLRENLEAINQKIKDSESTNSFNAERIFLELPWNLTNSKEVQEVVPLKRPKRLTVGDISFAKKYLEDKFLNWDDFCIHNVVLNYEVEGVSYDSPPLGVWAKRIKLRSHLLWVKDKIHKDIEDIFSNSDRNFSGFVASPICLFSSAFGKKEKLQVVVSIDYSSSHFVVIGKDRFTSSEEFGFGLKSIVGALAQRFILDFSLAQEVFYRYISFKEIPYFKEITIKKDQGYVNLSTQTLNSFVKDYIKGEVAVILKAINKSTQEQDFAISFAGRLNVKEGFYSFLKDCIPWKLRAPAYKEVVSSSFGCLRYGVSRFLESEHKKDQSLVQRILSVYKEYF